MGYVTSELPAGTSRALKLAVCDDFSGGVSFSGNERVSDGKIPYMYNMTYDSGVLRTRDGMNEMYDGRKFEGQYHGGYQKEIAGHVIVHIGKTLVALNTSTDELKVLHESMPDEKSLMVFFCGKLYIYCDTMVFSVDSELALKEEIPEPISFQFTTYPGVIYSNADYNYNLLAPVVSATFSQRNPDGNREYAFPNRRDVTKPYRVLCNGAEADESHYTLVNNGQAVRLDKTYEDVLESISFVYYLNQPSIIGFDKDLFKRLNVIESYGGETLTGTRIYASGDSKYPGRIYISELMNPLKFLKNNYETIGGDIGNITGFIRQYGKLILFTENNVMRMTYSYQSSSPVYTVKELNSQIGCDMPGSIQLIDNRVVFANSSKGVFIIDSTEDFGEQNIKPVSQNINSKNELSFLNCPKEDRLLAASIDFDRKYILSVGDKMYVWDYGSCAYSDSGNYSKAQKRLEWYIYTGVGAKQMLSCDGKLICIHENDGIGIAMLENTGSDLGIPVHSCYQSEKISLQYTSMLKTAEKLVLDIKCTKAGRIRVYVGDIYGEYFSTELYLDANAARDKVSVTIPKKSVSRFYFGIECDAAIELYSAAIYYRLSQKQR